MNAEASALAAAPASGSPQAAKKTPFYASLVVTGIAGMEDIRKVGRAGGKAIVYFEVVSTFALLAGLLVGSFIKTGTGFNANPATLDAHVVTAYAEQAKAIGNGVATLVVARWEKELDGPTLQRNLS